jgi:cyanophycin synthetase
MGSPHATTLLTLKVSAPPLARIDQARLALAQRLPAWVKPHHADHFNAQSPPERVLAMLLLDAILGLQQDMGVAVGPVNPGCLPMEFSSDGLMALYVPADNLKASELTVRCAVELIHALLGDEPNGVSAALAQLRQDLTPYANKGVNTFFILQAAHRLGIPVFKPTAGLLVLGTGERSRWLQSLVTDATSFLGVNLAQNKHQTAALLRAAGLPGSQHLLVGTQERALQAAQALGYPLVVKPADADRGEGVTAGLKSAQAVAAAFEQAIKVSRKVLVERWVAGHTHRLTVQEGRVVRVVRRTAGGVVGDGVSTIEALVERFQQTPQQQRFARRLGHPPLSLDAEALSLLDEQGLTPQSQPAPGDYVVLRRRDNANAGGTNEDLDPQNPQQVHPDNVGLAIEAARVLRLDFAGIDYITTDIARSWLDVGGVICEVNARPQMGGSNDPELYQNVLTELFPNGASIRCDLWVVPSDQAIEQRLVQQLAKRSAGVDVSCREGLWMGGQRRTPPFIDSFAAAQALLQRREVKHALCLMTPHDIRRSGLPLSQWDVIKVVQEGHFSAKEVKFLARIRAWLGAAVRSA